jgi:translation initiation factor 2A
MIAYLCLARPCSGDSRLFLMSADGKVAAAVSGLKDGPVHDFAWLPRGDGFVVVSGKSPPAATLHDRSGAVTYSFGAGAMNTVCVSPHGRFLLLGGFG